MAPKSLYLVGALVWRRCVPTESQRLAWLAESEFCSRQTDAFVDQYGVWDPDGGLADDETLEASWDEEAWDDPAPRRLMASGS